MTLLWAIGAGIVLLAALAALYSIFTDPARIDEQEDQEVGSETPAERNRFLNRFRRPNKEEAAKQMADLGQSEFPGDTDSDISPDT